MEEILSVTPNMKSLSVLELSGSAVTNNTASMTPRFDYLSSLTLLNTSIDDMGLKLLLDDTGVTSLDITNPSESETGGITNQSVPLLLSYDNLDYSLWETCLSTKRRSTLF
ncbi:MAG: hypothetical protein R3C11_18875 [Planctomycetaceae bacterium]